MINLIAVTMAVTTLLLTSSYIDASKEYLRLNKLFHAFIIIISLAILSEIFTQIELLLIARQHTDARY